jgi:hypothetical protein
MFKNKKEKEELILFKKFNKANQRIIFHCLNLNMFDDSMVNFEDQCCFK